MEEVINSEQISLLKENKIIGDPTIEHSRIHFEGKNNIIFCENNVKLWGCSILFKGNNSLIYLSSSNGYCLNIQIVQVPPIYLNIQEHQNLIIGDDCSIGSNANIRTGDAHIVYDKESKVRLNMGSSVFIGDHVWLGHQIYVDKGVSIGSGAVVENNSHVPSNVVLKSNTIYSGNPVNLIKSDVFFTKDYVANFTKEDSKDFNTYSSRIFLYENVPGETLDIKKVDNLLSNFDVDEKLEFIQKLFIQNKKHNRFFI